MTARVCGVSAALTVSAVTFPVGVDVGEDRARTDVVRRVGRGDEGERRHDDVVAGADAATTRARCSAVVQLDTATACSACMRAAKASSKAATLGPWATHPDSRTSVTARTSSSPIHGRMTLIRLIGGAPPVRAMASAAGATTHELAQAVLEPDLRGEPQIMPGRSGIRKATGDTVDLRSGRARPRGRIHGAQRASQAPEDWSAAGDVVDALGDVAGRGQDVGRDVPVRRSPWSAGRHRRSAAAAVVDPLHPADQHLGVQAVDVHPRP